VVLEIGARTAETRGVIAERADAEVAATAQHTADRPRGVAVVDVPNLTGRSLPADSALASLSVEYRLGLLYRDAV
jgi:hypothetical protein